jgi:polysaccharide export outer membrane protein
MVRLSQGKRILTIGLLILIQPLAGCLNTTESTILPNRAGTMPNGIGPLANAGGPASMPSGAIQQARFSPPTVQGPGDALPDKPAMLGMPQPVPLTPVMMPMPLPTEKGMVSHPPHRVAPPDILVIEALRLVPRGPYKLEPLEALQIEIVGAFKDQIKGLYMISPEGTINLGHTLLPIPVAGRTVDQAQFAITEYIRKVVKADFAVNIALVQMRGMQNVRGEHLVRPDGTISLGMYGSVYVAGLTLGQVKCQIENHLAAYLVSPQISVDVLAYNSRKIYIIADGAGYGQQVIALPATGNETVLDAISRVQGLPPVASLKKIWVARPAPAGHPCSQILPVSWKAIVQGGDTTTNYQLLPGDRIYIASDPLICAYNYIDKLVAPVERVLGLMLLGSSTANSIRNNGNTGGVILVP